MSIFPNLKRKLFSIALSTTVLTTLLTSAAPLPALASTPAVDHWTITTSSSGSTQAAKELSQTVTATVYFSEPVTYTASASTLKSEFSVKIYGVTVGTGSNAAMDLSVVEASPNYMEFVVQSNSTNSPPTSPFFGLKAGNMTITAASGSTIPDIVSQSSSDALAWNSTTFADQIIDTGTAWSTPTVTSATASTPGTWSATITGAPSVRMANWFKIHVNGTVLPATGIPMPPSMPTIPVVCTDAISVHSHDFYDWDTAKTAQEIADTINNPDSSLNDYVTASASGSVLTITQADGTYSDGDVLSFDAYNYADQ